MFNILPDCSDTVPSLCVLVEELHFSIYAVNTPRAPVRLSYFCKTVKQRGEVDGGNFHHYSYVPIGNEKFGVKKNC